MSLAALPGLAGLETAADLRLVLVQVVPPTPLRLGSFDETPDARAMLGVAGNQRDARSRLDRGRGVLIDQDPPAIGHHSTDAVDVQLLGGAVGRDRHIAGDLAVTELGLKNVAIRLLLASDVVDGRVRERGDEADDDDEADDGRVLHGFSPYPLLRGIPNGSDAIRDHASV